MILAADVMEPLCDSGVTEKKHGESQGITPFHMWTGVRTILPDPLTAVCMENVGNNIPVSTPCPSREFFLLWIAGSLYLTVNFKIFLICSLQKMNQQLRGNPKSGVSGSSVTAAWTSLLYKQLTFWMTTPSKRAKKRRRGGWEGKPLSHRKAIPAKHKDKIPWPCQWPKIVRSWVWIGIEWSKYSFVFLLMVTVPVAGREKSIFIEMCRIL